MEEKDNKEIRKIYYRKFSEGVHTTIKELIKNPPEGYEFIVEENKGVSISDVSGLKKNKTISFFYNKFFRKIISPYKLMSFLYKFKKIPECDFIYTYGDLITRKKNWVVELDSVWDFIGNQNEQIKNKKKIERILSSKYCKKIMPWNSWSKKTIEKELDTEKFKDKIEVVHIAAEVPFQKKKKGEKMKILFVGTSNQINDYAVYSKGIREVVRAFNILSKRNKNIELIVISQIPDSLKKEIEENKNIKVLGVIPRKEIFEVYGSCDLFVYPAYFSQSLSIVEALGNGLPVITTNIMIDEEDSMVEDGKNGFLIRIPDKESYRHPSIPKYKKYIEDFYEKNRKIIVEKIVGKVSELIEDEKLREWMGRNSRKKYLKEYSIEARNKKLKKIFDEIGD